MSVTVGIGPASTEMELVTVALASVATVTELADEVSGMVGAVMASGGGVTVTVHIRKIRGKTRRAVSVCVCVCVYMCVCVCVCLCLSVFGSLLSLSLPMRKASVKPTKLSHFQLSRNGISLP